MAMNLKGIFYSEREGLATTKVVFFLLVLVSFSLVLVKPATAQEPGSISGIIFEDLNINQTKNIGENGLAGSQVDLYQNNNLIQTKTTLSNGSYSFNNYNYSYFCIFLILLIYTHHYNFSQVQLQILFSILFY